MTDPALIASGANALELIYDIIAQGTTPTPTASVNLFMGYTPPTDQVSGFVYFVDEWPSTESEFTMGTVVAVEHQQVDVLVSGAVGDYAGPKHEMMRLRYLIASKQDFTSRGLRLMYAMPKGNVRSMGRDGNNRAVFMASFECFLDPSYQ
jgi:hypothetical protein